MLRPASRLFGGVVALRNGLYDRGRLRVHAASIPAVSVGNIAVGGGGKTPVSAWLARQLAFHGAAPGIVMRGYGGDEPLVHRELNPDIPVLLYADRVAGIQAAARIGCDVVVLDDAFQHRRAGRTEDMVLLSADSWTGSTVLLPAGPWREPLSAVRRASLALVTVRTAGAAVVNDVLRSITDAAPAVPVAVGRLAPAELRSLSGDSVQSLEGVRGKRVLAVAGIADAEPFFVSLERLGATVTRLAFSDHHRFSARDVAAIRSAASRQNLVVCTLKDAVKLRSVWPPEHAAAWYVSQAVSIEQGMNEVAALIGRLLAARAAGEPRQRDLAT
ncbi:MAG TPA: tetraacyldisaccharide 4'-kinase [Gemmatimonadaceae bacterium]|nr:tetraacyldisaccharide 4'-kinase [Gemmatimonadaceae bacterium]